MTHISSESILKFLSKTGRSLLRDHIELKQLQYTKDLDRFVHKALVRVKNSMAQFFNVNEEVALTFADEIENESTPSGKITSCIVNPIESIENFKTGLPFFAVVVFMEKKTDPVYEFCAIDFPALNQTIYASTEEGLWLTQAPPYQTTQKLKAPKGQHKISNAKPLLCSNVKLEQEEYKSSTVLNFGSSTYAALCTFNNNVRTCFCKDLDPATTKALYLMTKEYGGHTLMHPDNVLQISTNKLTTRTVLRLENPQQAGDKE